MLSGVHSGGVGGRGLGCCFCCCRRCRCRGSGVGGGRVSHGVNGRVSRIGVLNKKICLKIY